MYSTLILCDIFMASRSEMHAMWVQCPWFDSGSGLFLRSLYIIATLYCWLLNSRKKQNKVVVTSSDCDLTSSNVNGGTLTVLSATLSSGHRVEVCVAFLFHCVWLMASFSLNLTGIVSMSMPTWATWHHASTCVGKASNTFRLQPATRTHTMKIMSQNANVQTHRWIQNPGSH